MTTLTKVLAVGFGCWGSGDCSSSALNRWAKEVGHRLFDYDGNITVELRAVPDTFEMDGLFNLSAARIVKLPSISLTKAERDRFWGGIHALEEKLFPVTDVILELDDCNMGQ